MLYFSILFSGHGKGPFIVLAVANVLPFCPLTAFIWSRCTCRPLGLCDIHPCQTEAGLFYSSVYRNISSCHGINAFSLYSQGMHPTVPPQTCLFWVVYHPNRTYLPKGLGQESQNRPFPLSPPPNHTPFTSYLWPMAPPRPILVGYRLVVPGRTYLLKGLGQKPQNRSFPLSPPPNHTPFTSYLWPHHVLY